MIRGGAASTIVREVDTAMKRNLLVAVIVALCIVTVIVVFLRYKAPLGMPARVAVADDRAFFPVVHELLTSAESSIDVILYQCRFYFHYPMSASNTLITDLVDAAGRGVRVRVVLERADWNLDNTEENRDVWHVLRQGDMEVYFDPVGTTSHSKLVIVDDRYVVVGSTNWSHYAIDSNNEANVVIDSEEVGRQFKTYFEGIVTQSDTEYVAPIVTIAAADVEAWDERYVLIRDVADSAVYDPLSRMGRLYLRDVLVGVVERPLEEILAVDSLFFAKAGGETVRVLGRFQGDSRTSVQALDVELRDTPGAMANAFALERKMLKTKELAKPSLEWMEPARVRPIPNRHYAGELRRLIRSAKSRIWAALADARYYDRTPDTARREERTGQEASLTNMILGELVSAAVNGIEVRFVFDMGWRDSPPPTKTAFLERLQAGGANIYEDASDVTTHAKLLIVDDDFVVLGSTNWSYHAFEESNETSVIIESPELNRHYAAYIDAVIQQGTPYE
jgi:phosphatidylserine/phosphatidylglycerophosphate/cardiolipin synthase-like enzyme